MPGIVELEQVLPIKEGQFQRIASVIYPLVPPLELQPELRRIEPSRGLELYALVEQGPSVDSPVTGSFEVLKEPLTNHRFS
jgi:hypothetical protein